MRSTLFKNGTKVVPSDVVSDPSEYNIYRVATHYAYEQDFPYILTYSTPKCDEDPMEVLKKAEISFDIKVTQIKSVKKNSKDYFIVSLDNNSCFVLSHREKASVGGRIWGRTEEDVMRWYDIFAKLFPEQSMTKSPTVVPYRFWSESSDGPTYSIRDINALAWGDISQNYPDTVSGPLNSLMRVRPPIEGGKIILWHGPPGTGKSSAIRALTQAWFPWCDPAYIVDPERFFGNAQYMMDVLLSSSVSDYYWEDEDDEDDEDETSILTGKDRWRLLILEDTDEFIQADAKDRTGQALSRLLNLGDGLIGAGLNFLTLITTNEPLQNIHDAVSREGRALANLHFRKFKSDEVRNWFDINAPKEEFDKVNLDKHQNEWTLAQMYDALRNLRQISTEEEVGSFGVYL